MCDHTPVCVKRVESLGGIDIVAYRANTIGKEEELDSELAKAGGDEIERCIEKL